MRLRLLLVDTNVIILLVEISLWQILITSCDVHVSETVMQEALYWEDDEGQRYSINMEDYRSRLTVHAVPALRVKALRDGLAGSMLDKMDAGEAELLCILADGLEPYLVCSGDAVVYRYLGAIRQSAQGLSLEEVLMRIGRTQQVPVQFTKAFKENTPGKDLKKDLLGRPFADR